MFVLFVVGCRGHPHSYYQKALLSNGVTSALRLHQRVPHFQFSREYLAQLFLEDSAHYLFYSLIFVTGPPVSSILGVEQLFASIYQLKFSSSVIYQSFVVIFHPAPLGVWSDFSCIVLPTMRVMAWRGCRRRPNRFITEMKSLKRGAPWHAINWPSSSS